MHRRPWLAVVIGDAARETLDERVAHRCPRQQHAHALLQLLPEFPTPEWGAPELVQHQDMHGGPHDLGRLAHCVDVDVGKPMQRVPVPEDPQLGLARKVLEEAPGWGALVRDED